MKMKVCGMREPDNIQALVDEVRPDWMGLIFYPPSPRYVFGKPIPLISRIEIKKVGVFVDEHISSIKKTAEEFGLSTIQMHGKETAEEVKTVKEEIGLEVFKVFSVSEKIDWTNLEAYLPYADYFLFDTFTKDHGGSGKRFNWELLRDYPFDKPFLLSGGISPSNTQDILKFGQLLPQLAGVDINSGFEISPGLKDVKKVSEFKDKIQ